MNASQLEDGKYQNGDWRINIYGNKTFGAIQKKEGEKFFYFYSRGNDAPNDAVALCTAAKAPLENWELLTTE